MLKHEQIRVMFPVEMANKLWQVIVDIRKCEVSAQKETSDITCTECILRGKCHSREQLLSLMNEDT